jgi:hypothetical protein
MDDAWEGFSCDIQRLERIVDALGGVHQGDAATPTESMFESQNRELSMTMNSTNSHGEVAFLDGEEVTENDFFKAVDDEMGKVDVFIRYAIRYCSFCH